MRILKTCRINGQGNPREETFSYASRKDSIFLYNRCNGLGLLALVWTQLGGTPPAATPLPLPTSSLLHKTFLREQPSPGKCLEIFHSPENVAEVMFEAVKKVLGGPDYALYSRSGALITLLWWARACGISGPAGQSNSYGDGCRHNSG